MLNTQDDHVRKDQGFVPEETTHKVTVPGLAQLHERPIAEIAEVLANILRAEKNIVKLTYTIGESIELVSKTPVG